MNALVSIETAIANSPDIATLLPPDVPVDKFRSIALAAIRNNADLLRCDQRSLFNAVLNAAQDGLLPDGREGVIVLRKGRAVWQPMIRGIYKRIKSSGSVAALAANVVYEGEQFLVELGDDERIVHRRDLSLVAPGHEAAVYAIATMKDGSKEREVMTWEQIMAVRQSSSSPNSSTWTQWGDEMARKTVVRRLAKRLPVLDDGDERLHRTIERVDSLYDFGTKPPEHPAAEAITSSEAEVAPPVKAAAASIRSERLVGKSQVYATPKNGNDKPKARGYREILDSLKTALRDAESREQIDRVLENEEIRAAKQTFKDDALAELLALGAAALKRWYHEPTVDTDETWPDDVDSAAEPAHA